MERRIDLQFGFGDVITKLKSSPVRKPLDSLIPLYQCSLSGAKATTKNKLQIRPIPYCNKTLCQNIKQFHQHHQTIEKVL